MKKYVSLDKRSKKAQKEYYSRQRLSWGILNPVTRSIPSGKTYNRKKYKQERLRIGKEAITNIMENKIEDRAGNCIDSVI